MTHEGFVLKIKNGKFERLKKISILNGQKNFQSLKLLAVKKLNLK